MSDQSRRLVRRTEDKVIAGVAGGVADFFGIDATIVRVLWVLTVLLGGFGVVAYVVLWIVTPEDESDRSLADDLRDKTAKTGEDVTGDAEE